MKNHREGTPNECNSLSRYAIEGLAPDHLNKQKKVFHEYIHKEPFLWSDNL